MHARARRVSFLDAHFLVREHLRFANSTPTLIALGGEAGHPPLPRPPPPASSPSNKRRRRWPPRPAPKSAPQAFPYSIQALNERFCLSLESLCL